MLTANPANPDLVITQHFVTPPFQENKCIFRRPPVYLELIKRVAFLGPEEGLLKPTPNWIYKQIFFDFLLFWFEPENCLCFCPLCPFWSLIFDFWNKWTKTDTKVTFYDCIYGGKDCSSLISLNSLLICLSFFFVFVGPFVFLYVLLSICMSFFLFFCPYFCVSFCLSF